MLAVVGLGYVGLPLAVAFGQQRAALGFDIDRNKVDQLRQGRDPNKEVTPDELQAATRLSFSFDPADLSGADTFVVTVPTPVDAASRPDLEPLLSACRMVGEHLDTGATVIFESTVYPGCTEEACIPALERASGLKWRDDFVVAYAPERINPGDGMHSLTTVARVVGADSTATLERVVSLYESVVGADIHRVSSLRVAEASKVIENTQRDLNIALMNELAIIFHRLEVDTSEVLEAAATKWNFLPFKPGLVGGHCIGVDPYYLTYKAEMVGYHPEVVLAGRRINDRMGVYIARQTADQIEARGGSMAAARIGVMGFSFKENTADVRNTRVADLVRELIALSSEVLVHDPVADAAASKQEHGIDLIGPDRLTDLDAIILAVPHAAFVDRPNSDYLAMLKPEGVVMDIKSVLEPQAFREAGIAVWRL